MPIKWENTPVKPERETRGSDLRRENFSTKRINDYCKAVNLRHNF